MLIRTAVALSFALTALSQEAPFPKFREHVINAEAGTGLAITVADVNNDGKPDIVGVSADDVYWYENPDWTPHLIADTIKNSNVCVAPHDLNGDGTPELALGADWQFNNTESGGALYLLHANDDVRKPWNIVELLADEPTLHRIRWADVEGDGAMELVVAPLKGVGSMGPNFDDKPVKLFLLRPDKADPFKAPWTEEIIDESLHVLHNIWNVVGDSDNRDSILTASYEGIAQHRRLEGGKWVKWPYFEGNPVPIPQSGAGEIKASTPLAERRTPQAAGTAIAANVRSRMLATIEPWHGHQAVAYFWDGAGWQRFVFDDGLRSGHAIWWSDFDQDGEDELLVGYRDKAPPGNKAGLQIYDLDSERSGEGGTSWAAFSTKHVIDDGGMATEDALAHDMNGDGWPDVVAFGRATHNIKYYENLGLVKTE